MLTWFILFSAAIGLVMVIMAIVAALQDPAEGERARMSSPIRTGKWKRLRAERKRHLR